MVNYNQCPACKSIDIFPKLEVQDYTVSNEKFSIWHCANCSLRFTQDVADQSAIGKYYQSDNYISHSDTKTGLVNSLYHSIRKFTLNLKRALVQKQTQLKSGSILDIGCGTGAFLNTMKEAGWKITGLEPDETAIKKAKALYQIHPQSPSELFNLSDQQFDAITMWHVLEHVHQLNEYLFQLRKILKDNGTLFIAVPNYTSFDAQFYKETWAAYDVPRHLYHFSPKSIEMLVKRYGMKIKTMKPMWFDSYYVSMLSEKYRDNKLGLIRAFIIGNISNILCLFNKSKCSSVIYVIQKMTN
jgi:2-polyprenyl-3-methyl-5-hydroxy-6-metoxy-1,4-benzoquinol methylase